MRSVPVARLLRRGNAPRAAARRPARGTPRIAAPAVVHRARRGAPPRTVFVLTLAALLSVVLLCPPAAAQTDELDAVAKEIAARLAREKVRSVVIGDILGPGETRTELGELLAGELTAAMEPHSGGFQLVSRARWKQKCDELDLSAARMLYPGTARWLAERVSAEAILVGQIELEEGAYLLRLDLHFTYNGNKNHRIESRLTRTPQLERLAAVESPRIVPPPESGVPKEVFRPGKDGMTYPRCRHCPDPRFTSKARRAQSEGRVLLRIIITGEGRPARIRVVEGEVYDLTQQAIAAVRRWRFHPARDASGAPVATDVVVEIFFRLVR